MSDLLKYDHPAKAWHHALPIGNGRMGAMIYGDPTNETFALNEDSLWSGFFRDKNRAGAASFLPSIRELMEKDERVLAEEYINRYTLAEMCETYLPFADMTLQSSEAEITDYLRTLDISRGVFEMSCKKNGLDYSQTCFASYPAGVMVFKIRTEKADDFKLSISSKLKYTTSANGNTVVLRGIAPESNLPFVRGFMPPTVYGNEKTTKSIRFCGVFEIITDGTVEGGEVSEIKNATDIEIRMSLATSFISPLVCPDADEYERAIAPLEKTRKMTYEELLSDHEKDFYELYSRFYISIGDEPDGLMTDERLIRASNGEIDPSLSALLVRYGRYLMISSSRPGSHATNLQGIWNDQLHPAWCSNYTLDINTEMNYWGADVTGLSECAQPLYDYIYSLSENGKKTADVHYGCRGWVAHPSSDIWAYTPPCGPVNERRGCTHYAAWTGPSGWLCRHLYEGYLYRGDKEFLRSVYPIMLGAARFYLDFMTEDKNGHLVMNPSVSPENAYKYGNEKCSADIMPTVDKQIIMELFTNCLEAASELGDDDDILEEIRTALPKIEPMKINADGSLSEWSCDFEEAEPDHRHISHLYGVYPGRLINDNTPELKAAAEKTLDKRGNQGTGWGITWKSCVYARLGNAEKAYEMLKLIFNRIPPDAKMGNTGGGLYDNLFDACPPFQIDGNFGVIASVMEMLFCDDVNGVKLLPACPKEWHKGEIRGLKLRGGKTLSFKWENGEVTEKTIV